MASTLGILNLLIAAGYFAVVAFLIIAPLKKRWIQALGPLWLLLAIFAGVFFGGCATHHVDMALHLFNDPAFIRPGELWHFLIVDGMQPVGALGALWIVVYRGEALLDCLLEALARYQPEFIHRLAARLEER